MKVRTGAAAVALTALGMAVRRATHTWGATSVEQVEVLPGDELVADPAIVATRAVTVDATVEDVWSWLVQIGQNRGGMYSYDWAENLLGLDIHSTDEMRSEWQTLATGDRIVLVPARRWGIQAGYALPVAGVDPPTTLVLRQSPPEHPWDAVWSFHVRALPDGRTRLLSRGRCHRHRGGRGIVDLGIDALMDPVTWLMTRKMLLGIKERAERRGDAQMGPAQRSQMTRHGLRDPGSSLQRRLERDVARLHLPDQATAATVVTEHDLAGLPEPARRYLRWAGVTGRPQDRAFWVRFRGEFRMRPGGPWMPYQSWQYNRAEPVTRVARMRIDAGGVVPMFGTDTYVDSTGAMDGKLLGLVPVAEGRGPEFDLGELVTYVNDAVMIAPSMLLFQSTKWRAIDDWTFDVIVSDGPNRVAARCIVDDQGRLTLFETDDRWYAGTKPPTRTTWSTPFQEWTTLPDGRRIPAAGSAVWHLADGDFVYVRGTFEADTLRFDTFPVIARTAATGPRR